MHGEKNLICLLRQLHFDSFHPAVLNAVVEGFLENAKEAQPNIKRQNRTDFSLEVDFYSVPFGEFPAPAPYTRENSQVLELGRVQLMREPLHIVGNLNRLLLQFPHAAFEI